MLQTVVYITGPTCSGKTTASIKLSKELGMPIVDADAAYDILHELMNVPNRGRKLTDYRRWGNPQSFGLDSWMGYDHLDALKPDAYRKILANIDRNFIIEGFTLSFISERRIIHDLVGAHKSVIIRIMTSFEQWVEFYIKRNGDETVANRIKDFTRLTNCFEADVDSTVLTVSHPAQITKDWLETQLSSR
ncbi:MAG: isopentenyl transferase family protein [Roseinatronobacter sp.]